MKLRSRLRIIWYLLKQSVIEFVDDNGMKLSAALSYYTIFSIPPLLIIVISICGFFFGKDAVQGEVFGQINDLVGNSAALEIQNALKNITLSGNNTVATVISLIVIFFGASGVFSEIQDSINFIWGLKAKPNKGFVKFVKNRLMSFSMIGSVGFILLVGLFINAVMDLLSGRLTERFHRETFYSIYFANLIIVFLIITLLFTVIFKTLPDGKIVLRDCVIGASFTTFLFMIGKFAIGYYLGKSSIASVYGAAGSVVLILIWVYYSAIILYFGAEFTKVFASTHGQKIVPNEYSVLLDKSLLEKGIAWGYKEGGRFVIIRAQINLEAKTANSYVYATRRIS